MRYRFINKPVFFPAVQYEVVVKNIVQRLSSIAGVRAVFQLGNVKAPGISDLDILVVFKEGVKYLRNPIDRVDAAENYFLIHNVFGLSEAMMESFVKYQPHFSGQLIFGEGQELRQQQMNESTSELWRQIAIEYLVKNYLVSASQQVSGIIKLRQLLLEANATKYDLDILNENGRLRRLIDLLIQWRGQWFTNPPAENELSEFFDEYCDEQKKFLQMLFKRDLLFVPKERMIHVSRQLSIQNSKSFGVESQGGYARALIQRSPIQKVGRLIQRLQSVKLDLPMKAADKDTVLFHRFRFFQQALLYNAEFIRHFMPPVSVIPF